MKDRNYIPFICTSRFGLDCNCKMISDNQTSVLFNSGVNQRKRPCEKKCTFVSMFPCTSHFHAINWPNKVENSNWTRDKKIHRMCLFYNLILWKRIPDLSWTWRPEFDMKSISSAAASCQEQLYCWLIWGSAEVESVVNIKKKYMENWKLC